MGINTKRIINDCERNGHEYGTIRELSHWSIQQGAIQQDALDSERFECENGGLWRGLAREIGGLLS